MPWVYVIDIHNLKSWWPW